MITFYGTGTFRGMSELFAGGHSYGVRVSFGWFGAVTVQAVHGYEQKILEGYRISYGNLIDLLRDWDIKPNEPA